MRLFQGMRRPMGGFVIDPDEPNRRQQQVRDDRKAEADRLRYIRLVQQTNRRLEMMMRTMDEVLELVYAQRGQIESLATLTGTLKERLTEALASAGSISPAQQAQIDKVFDELDKNRSAVVKAINANDDDPSNDEKPAEGGGGEVGAEPKPAEPAKTKVEVSSSKNPSDVGDEVTFTAAVSGAGNGPVDALTGSVTFYADDVVIGTGSLDSTGVAAIAVRPPEGEHDITATYGGDKNYAPSDSAEFTQVVKAAEKPAEDKPADTPAVDTPTENAQG